VREKWDTGPWRLVREGEVGDWNDKWMREEERRKMAEGGRERFLGHLCLAPLPQPLVGDAPSLQIGGTGLSCFAAAWVASARCAVARQFKR
jgi:hypothetical protein